MRRLKGMALLATGILACPCHLPLTLGLLAVVFGGTALGAFLQQHTGLVVAAATGYFLVAIVLGLRYLGVGTTPSGDSWSCEVPPRTATADQAASAAEQVVPVGRR